MTDQATALQARIAEGEQAKELQNNPYFTKLLDGLEASYFKLWRDCPDLQQREKLHGMVNVVQDFRLNIQQAVDNATAARSYIERQNHIREAEEKSGPLA